MVNNLIDISLFIDTFSKALDKNFGERVWFFGLQGSYAREEATENSDIDIVVILDKLLLADIECYNEMLDALSHRELICGFLSGKTEILNWEPSDLFHFYYDTKPVRGSLDELLPLLDGVAVERAIKTGACNIYHGCVHNMLYEKSEEILQSLYKAASFVVQAVVFRESSTYINRQKDLMKVVNSNDRKIIETYIALKNGERADFSDMSDFLFTWAGKLIEG